MSDLRTDKIQPIPESGRIVKLLSALKLTPRRWFWVNVILVSLALLLYIGSRWHSVAAMQNAARGNVTFLDFHFCEVSGDLFLPDGIDQLYRKTIGPVLIENFGPHKEIQIRNRICSIFSGPIKKLSLNPLSFPEANIGDAICRFRFLESFSYAPYEEITLPPKTRANLIAGVSSCELLESIFFTGFTFEQSDLDKLAALPNLKEVYFRRCKFVASPEHYLPKFSHLTNFTIHSDDWASDYDVFDLKDLLGENCLLTINEVEIRLL